MRVLTQTAIRKTVKASIILTIRFLRTKKLRLRFTNLLSSKRAAAKSNSTNRPTAVISKVMTIKKEEKR